MFYQSLKLPVNILYIGPNWYVVSVGQPALSCARAETSSKLILDKFISGQEGHQRSRSSLVVKVISGQEGHQRSRSSAVKKVISGHEVHQRSRRPSAVKKVISGQEGHQRSRSSSAVKKFISGQEVHQRSRRSSAVKKVISGQGHQRSRSCCSSSAAGSLFLCWVVDSWSIFHTMHFFISKPMARAIGGGTALPT